MSSLFISYRRADAPGAVKALHDRLAARLPRWTVFYDHTAIAPGEDFPDRLRREVAAAAVVLVVVGPRWLPLLNERLGGPGTDHVREEVRLALAAGNTVIPVPVENAPIPTEADLADFPDLLPLARLNARPVRPDPDFDPDLDRLAAYLDGLGPGVGPGTVLGGRYKVLREVGQGGMGVVYEAEQQQPRRRVAVKMVLEGMNTREVLARFDGEKEALARMDHPNIARVIDAGFGPRGQPYFVMEFVQGEPVTAYCDRKRLPPADRLALFARVCAAVQHAHQRGVIHRDIKPSNVLVEEADGRPVPKVIDFGLAKALAGRLGDRTLVSEHGKVVGTLLYAAPEQAAGRAHEVDTRSDVYALGALLYELLVGTPPFTETELTAIGDEAMRRQVIEAEPARPSGRLSRSAALPAVAASRRLDPRKLRRLVRGELDWVVMKALEKAPDARYPTPDALAADIERFLRHEPVTARRPGVLLRARKWARRNAREVRVVAAGASALLVLGAGWVGLSDAGYNPPGAGPVRAYLDDHDLSVVRPTPSDADLLAAARGDRAALLDPSVAAYWRGEHFAHFKGSPSPADEWSHHQMLAALRPDDEFARANGPRLAALLGRLFDRGFLPDHGWAINREYTLEPVAWGLSAYASAARYAARPERFEDNLSALQRVLDHGQCRAGGRKVGAWGLFAHEVGDGTVDLYVTAVVLHGLLDLRAAGLGWNGSPAERDLRIRQAVEYLVGAFDGRGWKVSGPAGYARNPEIAMLVLAGLLRAGAEADAPLDPEVVAVALPLLRECVRRPTDFPDSICLFESTYVAPDGSRKTLFNKPVKMFWYPYGVSLAGAYRTYADRIGSRREADKARRALGQLLIDRRDEFLPRFRDADGVFVVAELILALAVVGDQLTAVGR